MWHPKFLQKIKTKSSIKKLKKRKANKQKQRLEVLYKKAVFFRFPNIRRKTPVLESLA